MLCGSGAERCGGAFLGGMETVEELSVPKGAGVSQQGNVGF